MGNLELEIASQFYRAEITGLSKDGRGCRKMGGEAICPTLSSLEEG